MIARRDLLGLPLLAAGLVALGPRALAEAAPLKLNWHMLRPKRDRTAELIARIEAMRRGEAVAPPPAPTGGGSAGDLGLVGFVPHGGGGGLNPGVDGANLDISAGADEAPFSFRGYGGGGAPDLVMALDGKLVQMPGYTVPLDYEADGTRSFLLVPYVGACIHVPPPPSNQIVVVESETPYLFEGMFEAVLVTGVLAAKPVALDLADVGYQLAASRIEAFDLESDGAGWMAE